MQCIVSCFSLWQSRWNIAVTLHVLTSPLLIIIISWGRGWIYHIYWYCNSLSWHHYLLVDAVQRTSNEGFRYLVIYLDSLYYLDISFRPLYSVVYQPSKYTGHSNYYIHFCLYYFVSLSLKIAHYTIDCDLRSWDSVHYLLSSNIVPRRLGTLPLSDQIL